MAIFNSKLLVYQAGYPGYHFRIDLDIQTWRYAKDWSGNSRRQETERHGYEIGFFQTKWIKWIAEFGHFSKLQSCKPKSGWWFGTFFIFPYIGNNHPN